MAIQAIVLLKRGEFLAELSDGRRLTHNELCGLAEAMHQAGVLAVDMRCEWRSGHRMLTAGQQVAFGAEMLRLEKEDARHPQPVRAAEPAREPAHGLVLIA
ncbi:MAG: hypothetical protein LBE81_06935 [Azonexus sp.]|jgi:hypothetical protein|uniref:hypothetical protein n=1 Tax=Azonexus sp. TaxID=1872668 RepID=UPI002832ED79|nr:hypothetical protein [Azonexus sp.]MDR0776357.1 hypothetical protein [Azonexus sp.]